MEYEGIVGEIKLFSFDYEIRDWMNCDGRTLKIDKYTMLYSVQTPIISKHSYDQKVFNIPFMEAPEGFSFKICFRGIYPSRE
jgi:hypothetical protein